MFEKEIVKAMTAPRCFAYNFKSWRGLVDART
jgi:hypothetical protein